MPAFPSRGLDIGRGLAMLHGFPPVTAAEPPIDLEAAEIGRKLVSAEGGFSCVSCHAIGTYSAAQLFESPGINLAYSGERLLQDYFDRWMRDPLRVDPTSKMPRYFEDGTSPLFEYYDGRAKKQIDALWQYIRLGDRMADPSAD